MQLQRLPKTAPHRCGFGNLARTEEKWYEVVVAFSEERKLLKDEKG